MKQSQKSNQNSHLLGKMKINADEDKVNSVNKYFLQGDIPVPDEEKLFDLTKRESFHSTISNSIVSVIKKDDKIISK